MPNGGVPLHMILQPSLGEGYILYARGSDLHIIARDDWQELGVEAEPLLSLSPPEVRVLAAFVRCWSGDEAAKPIYALPGVMVEYDW